MARVRQPYYRTVNLPNFLMRPRPFLFLFFSLGLLVFPLIWAALTHSTHAHGEELLAKGNGADGRQQLKRRRLAFPISCLLSPCMRLLPASAIWSNSETCPLTCPIA